MHQLILGSQSPRRKEILSYFSLPFEQVTPDFDEDTVLYSGDPEDYVCTISKSKADSLIPYYPEAIILTADTTVWKDGKNYGKPRSLEEAYQYLTELQGQWHSVFTGVTVRKGKQEFNKAEQTKVLFNPLTPDQIRHYNAKLHWSDKAGGYSIQMGGGLIVRRIEGCYYNAMGFPINTVRELLNHIGIELWDYLKS
jgi:septum formation protein